jgi:hypothetical protein
MPLKTTRQRPDDNRHEKYNRHRRAVPHAGRDVRDT